MKFEYSQEWYEKEYHAKGDYHLPERTWGEVQGEWDKKGHRKRFFSFLNLWKLDLDGKACIDIGCHHGKSMVWCLELYPEIKRFVGLDFSGVAIDWLGKEFPDKRDAIEFIQGDVGRLAYYFEPETFDVLFCIDMIEHLPEGTYRAMIEGIKYIARPRSLIVCQVGKTDQPEHIHIIPDEQVIKDFGLPCVARFGEYFLLEMPGKEKQCLKR